MQEGASVLVIDDSRSAGECTAAGAADDANGVDNTDDIDGRGALKAAEGNECAA